MKNLYAFKQYEHPNDLSDLFTLVRRRPAGRELDFPSLADLRELMEVDNTRKATRLWTAVGGELAGFAILHRGETYASLNLEIAAHENEDALAGEMIAWAEGFFHAQYHGKANSISVTTGENDFMRIALLDRHGFRRQKETALVLERNLADPLPSPDIPAGFSLRSLSGGEEAAWVALHQAAFGTQNMTLAIRQAMTQAPDYDSRLDLVAVAQDGTLAAYVYGSISYEENELSGSKIGYTDPIGTHPDYQREGLSRALLFECLRRLRERGMEVARLGTGSWNTAMQHAAESAGFRVVRRSLLFEKSIRHEYSP